jgi:hypothetical protein
MTSNEYYINGTQKYTNPTNANYMTIGSDTIDATGTVINPKFLSAMVTNSVNPTNLNLVNALSVASATSSPAYTINLQSAPAGVGSLWGIDYETTTGEDLQFTTSSATAGVSFNTVGNDNTTRIKNGRVSISGLTESATLDYNAGTWANTTNSTLIQPTEVKVYTATTSTAITPTKVELLEPASFFKKSTFEINQWLLKSGATSFTQFDPTEINIQSGNDTSRVTTTGYSTYNAITEFVSSIGNGVTLNTLSNIGTRISNAGINLGFNTGTSASAITMTTTDVTDGTNTKTWANILTGPTYLSKLAVTQAVQTTRRSFCSINSGAVIPAGTWIVSATVTIPTTTTNLQFSITGSLNAPVVDGTTPAGTAYAYGGNYVSNTSTTAPYTVSLTTTIVFDGTKVCSVGLATNPSQAVTSITLQAVRIG